MSKFIDLTGQIFGKLSVLSRANYSKSGKIKWNCICKCGEEVIVIGNNLKNSTTKSCGCLMRGELRQTKFIDLVGRRFEKLLVKNRDNNTKSGKARWNCLCDCGNEKIIDSYHLIHGNIKSCGCIKKEMLRRRNEIKNPLWTEKEDNTLKQFYLNGGSKYFAKILNRARHSIVWRAQAAHM